MKSQINWFPELLPEEQILMNNWIDISKNKFESYWYVPLETSVVENMDVLLAKWSDDKELYWVKRHLNIQEEDVDKKTKIWLHFDLTIPFARYVSSHFNDLSFPFKRYQIQKCWRWERPQLGRYREFLQVDVDVVWNEKLPLHFDAEVLEISIKILNSMIPNQFEMFFNNRKFFDWLCDYYNISEDGKKEFVKTIDKLDKIWESVCLEQLRNLSIPDELSQFMMESNSIELDINKIKLKFWKYIDNIIIQEAISDVEILIQNIDKKLIDLIKFKLNLARWLDYYTWSIFEWRLIDFPSLSICGWWRYENLTNTIWNKKLPWVGISLWMTRIFWLLEHLKKIDIKKKSNSALLIWWFSEIKRVYCNNIANTLRDSWINSEVYHNLQDKPSKQIKYAIWKGIEKMLFVWDNDELHLKDLNIGEQKDIDMQNLIDILHK